jgi:hypothetical protein
MSSNVYTHHLATWRWPDLFADLRHRDEILSLLGGDKKVEIEWSSLVTLRANGGRKRVPEYVVSRRTIH